MWVLKTRNGRYVTQARTLTGLREACRRRYGLKRRVKFSPAGSKKVVTIIDTLVLVATQED